MKMAFLSSTRGTNLQSFIQAGIPVECLVTDKADCGAVERAKAAGIPVHFVDPAGKNREAFDREVMKALDLHNVELVVLGGYMRIVGAVMVKRYHNRILNVHPSLLPKFAGGMDSDVHRQVLEAGERETGMTIHLVTESVDAGPILLQKKVPVEPGDTPETLKAKVQALEKEWYPKVVQQIADGRLPTKK